MTARTLICPLLSWGTLYGAYLVLVGQTSADELVAGAIVAAVATALSVAVRFGSRRRFDLKPSVWAVPAAKAFAGIPRDVGLVGYRLIRPRPGRFEQEQIRDLAQDADTSRAVQIITDSLAPNRFVVAITRGDEALVHRLAGSPP